MVDGARTLVIIVTRQTINGTQAVDIITKVHIFLYKYKTAILYNLTKLVVIK